MDTRLKATEVLSIYAAGLVVVAQRQSVWRRGRRRHGVELAERRPGAARRRRIDTVLELIRRAGALLEQHALDEPALLRAVFGAVVHVRQLHPAVVGVGRRIRT